MKVSFNFGTQKNVDPTLISSVIKYLIKEYTTDKFSDLHAGTGTMYINFYDSDGISKEIVAKDGRYAEYVIRGEPYQRKPKNVVDEIIRRLCGCLSAETKRRLRCSLVPKKRRTR